MLSTSKFRKACVSLSIQCRSSKNEDQRLVEAFARHDSLDRIECATLACLRFDRGDLLVFIGDTEQPIEVCERVFQRPIQCKHPPGNFLASRALVIRGSDPEVAPQEIDKRKIRRSLAV